MISMFKHQLAQQTILKALRPVKKSRESSIYWIFRLRRGFAERSLPFILECPARFLKFCEYRLQLCIITIIIFCRCCCYRGFMLVFSAKIRGFQRLSKALCADFQRAQCRLEIQIWQMFWRIRRLGLTRNVTGSKFISLNKVTCLWTSHLDSMTCLLEVHRRKASHNGIP